VAETAQELATRLDLHVADPGLVELALTHPSYAVEHGVESNQRLEFLGDAVLGLAVAEHLYERCPDFNEGQLSKIRIGVVNEAVLATVAGDLTLGPALKMGRGAETEGLFEKPSVLADTFEALLGALYLDQGFAYARNFAVVHLEAFIVAAMADPGGEDAKSKLNEWAQSSVHQMPRYELISSGSDHDPTFHAEVFVGESLMGTGQGRSKKLAEQEAAAAAWKVVEGG
jgi:ribonuclease-3